VSATALIAGYRRAWNAHDAEAVVACFAEDGVREWRALAPLHLSGQPFPRCAGREAIARGVQDLLGAIPDLVVTTIAAGACDDGRAWHEWRIQGTHRQDWGPWRARNEDVDFVGVSFLRAVDQRIAMERLYWDSLLMTGPAVIRP
jgi:hypothetical protein